MNKALDDYAEVIRRAVSRMELEQANPVAGSIKPKRHLGRIGLECFMAIVSAEWFELLKALRRNGPASVSGLARVLKRSEKTVQSDIAILLKSGLLSHTESGLVEVSWDEVGAELDLLAA
jgi:predicted transcriptional regulator